MREIDSLERKITRAESLLIGLSVMAIAGGDYALGREISLGYLYLIPLSYSALTHRWPVTLVLAGICVALRQWLGPLELAPTVSIVRDWVLTATFAGVVTTLYRLGSQRRKFFETARHQRDELLAEVRLAADVQRKLLEQHRPPAGPWDIAARTVQMKAVGGDYYDFLELPGGSLGIVIADVSGKGLSAAMLMPAVQIALRALAFRYSRTQDILHELNKTLYDAFLPASYATLFFCALDFESGRLRYANAGHHPALLLRASGSVERLSEGGTPVGLIAEANYQVGEAQIRPGDVLALYTDGISESANPVGDHFGDAHLERTVLEALSEKDSNRIIERLLGAAQHFRSGAEADDDMTAIVVRAPGARANGDET